MEDDPLDGRRTFFVTGNQGSGTTWTGNLIDAHPEAICLNEPLTRHGLIAPMLQFQQSRNQILASKGRQEFSIKNRTVIKLSRLLYGELFQDYDLSGVKLLGEKTPENSVGMRFIEQVFSGSLHIWVTRDIRDALMSRFKVARRENPNIAFLDYAKVFFNEFASEHIEGLRYLRKRHARRLLVVRYEDMLADPVSSLRRIYEFLGIATGEDLLLSALKSTGTADAEATSVDEVPILDPAARGNIGTWRAYDSDAFQALYAEGAKALNNEVGYET